MGFVSCWDVSGNQPRAVGKRTPRIPVRYTHESAEQYVSPPRQGRKSKLGAAADDVAAHEVALTLAEASHRVDSPQVSQTPKKTRDTAYGERMVLFLYFAFLLLLVPSPRQLYCHYFPFLGCPTSVVLFLNIICKILNISNFPFWCMGK